MLKDRLKEIERLNINCGVNSVYDVDGKTTQELLNQFFQKINAVIETTNASMSLLEYLIDAGLQKEIAQKLIEWIEDGTLKDIIDEDVLNEIHSKIDGAVDTVEKQRERIENIALQLEDSFEFLKKKESYNIKFYGAIGDGVTDDTEAFKKALNAVDYTEYGRTIFVPAGTYLISETLELKEGTSLCGEANSVIKFSANHVQIMLNGSDIEIKDLVFDGSDVTTTNVIKDNEDVLVYRTRIENVTFKNFTGAQISAVNLEEAKGVHILNCIFKDIKGEEVKCIKVGTYTQNIFIKNNTFNNIKYKSIYNKRYSIYIDSQQTLFLRDTNAVIENNYFDTDIHAHIYVNASNITVNNNSFITKSTYAGNCHSVLIDNTDSTKIKNNFYNLSNSIIILHPVLKINKGKNIFINDENIFIDGTLTSSSTENKPLFVFENADVIIDDMQLTGKHYTNGLFDISNMKQLTLRNSHINLDGRCEVVIRMLDGTENTNTASLTVENNNIELFKGRMLVFTFSTKDTYGKMKINNNDFYYSSSSNNEIPETINLKNFKTAVIKNNNFKDDIYLYDFEKLTLESNVLGKLYVSSGKYEILSQNNTFDGNDAQCYLLSCHSTQPCTLVSRNNYNKSNMRLIRFYSDVGAFLNANNMDVKTIDDINSDEVQKQNNLFIVRDDNVTVDIYKRCYVKTSQELQRFTWYSYDIPLIDYKKPHGAIIYNASTGKSTMYAIQGGMNRITSL